MRKNLDNDRLMRLDEAYSIFLKSKKASGAKEKTIENYALSYKYFNLYLADSEEYNGENVDISNVAQFVKCKDITPDTITDFIVYLRENRPHLRDILKMNWNGY